MSDKLSLELKRLDEVHKFPGGWAGLILSILTIEPFHKEQIKALMKAVEDAATPSGGYGPGDGSMDGAQIVNGEWWHPVMGCDSLKTTLDAIQDRLAFAICVWYAGSFHSKQEES